MTRSMKYVYALLAAGLVIGGLSAVGYHKEQQARLLPETSLRFALCDPDGVKCTVREQVLVGVGCGPERLTMTAREESDFPFQCEAITAHGVRPLDPQGY